MRVSMIGLGYVGLPLALICDEAGFDTNGFDISERTIAAVEKKEAQVDDAYACRLLQSSQINISKVLVAADVFIVCVPTPVDSRNEPDLIHIIEACKSICTVAQDGNLVVIESTIYPGVCEEVFLPIFLGAGLTVKLAHCPERVNPGDNQWTIKNIPRVVGGIDDQSLLAAYDFYSKIIDAEIKQVSSIKIAESSKILENIFRDVNIALVNEMAQAFYRMDIDASEVISAASTKPFGFMAHFPGVGVGGHCIAADPYYMIERGRQSGFDHEFLKLARKINTNMPIYTSYLIQNALNELGMPLKNTRVGIYGLAYKPNVADTRESPSYEVIKRLKNDKLADVRSFDPYVVSDSDFPDLTSLIKWCQVLVLCTAHDEIKKLDGEAFIGIDLIVDGRNALDSKKIKNLGIAYRGIGRN